MLHSLFYLEFRGPLDRGGASNPADSLQELIALLILLKMSPSCKAPTAVNWCNILTERLSTGRGVPSQPQGLAQGMLLQRARGIYIARKGFPAGQCPLPEEQSPSQIEPCVPSFFPLSSPGVMRISASCDRARLPRTSPSGQCRCSPRSEE